MGRCGNCGSETQPDKYFCDACGEPLFGNEPAGISPAQSADSRAIEQEPGGSTISFSLPDMTEIPSAPSDDLISFPQETEVASGVMPARETATGIYFRSEPDQDIEVVEAAQRPPSRIERDRPGSQPQPPLPQMQQPFSDASQPDLHVKRRPAQRHAVQPQRGHIQRPDYVSSPPLPRYPAQPPPGQHRPLPQPVAGHAPGNMQDTITSPSGKVYSRAEIQRLITERKKRLRRLMFVLIPAGAIVAGLIAFLLMLFVFNGGMSPEEYKQRAYTIHREVMSGFQRIDTDWITAEYDEDLDLSEAYDTLDISLEETSAAILAARSDLEELKPPQVMSDLHNGLLAYYEKTGNYLGSAKGVFEFISAWAKIDEDWHSKPWAIEKVSENSTPAEIIAYLDEDIAATEACISQFKALTAPAECQAMLEASIALLEEGRSLLERLKRAFINHDSVSLEAVNRDMEAYDNAYPDRWAALWESVFQFRKTFWDLMDEGKELGRRLGDTYNEGDEIVTVAL